VSLFHPAQEAQIRLKACVYGDPGIGKSMFSLQFPQPVVIDLEKGTVAYGGRYGFSVCQATTPSEVEEAIDELLADPQDFKTVVIDPISLYCDWVGDAVLAQVRLDKEDANYELTAVDYKPIGRRCKLFLRKLLALDMNVVVTAKVKDDFKEGSFMKKVGIKPDMHKALYGMFDTIIYIDRDDEGKRWGYTDVSETPVNAIVKDRTLLPPKFEFSYTEIERIWGKAGLIRPSEKLMQQTAFTDEVERDTDVTLTDGTSYKTAGIVAGQIERFREALSSKKLKTKVLTEFLKNKYSVDSIMNLREDEANLILAEFEI